MLVVNIEGRVRYLQVVSSGYFCGKISLLSFVSFVVVVKGLQVGMASDFHDGGSLDIGFFQLVDQSLSSAVVCQFLAAGFE